MENYFLKSKIDKLSPKKKEILKFLCVGAFCLLFNTILLYFLTEIINIQDLIAIAICFFCSNLVGFFLNKYFTFKAFKTNIWRELYKYYSVMGSSFLFNLILSAILIEVFKIWVIYASLIVAFIMTTYNYLLHTKWSFKIKNTRQKKKKTQFR